jgi:hypothetical protein
VDSGSTPVTHSMLKLDLTVSGKADVSLHGPLVSKTLNKRNSMKIETETKVSVSISARVRVTLVTIIVGLLGLGVWPVSPLI